MGVVDTLKSVLGRLTGRAREGLEAGKQKAANLTGSTQPPAGGTADVGSEDVATPASARDSELVGNETYFGDDQTSPVGPVDDLGAAAAGAAGTTEAAGAVSPVDIGATASDPDPAVTDSGVVAGEVPSIGDVSDSAGYAEPEPLPEPADLGPVGDVGELGPETVGAESSTFSDATTGLTAEPAAPEQSGFSADEVSGGLVDSRDDALDAVQAENEEIRTSRDEI